MIAFGYTLIVAATGKLCEATGSAWCVWSTVFFVAAIGAVLVTVTAPHFAHTLCVVAAELIWLATVRTYSM